MGRLMDTIGTALDANENFLTSVMDIINTKGSASTELPIQGALAEALDAPKLPE